MDWILRNFSAGDLGWLVEQHRERYRIDEGFDPGFGRVVEEAAGAFLADHDPAMESAWIAWSGAHRVGSIFCVRAEHPGSARLRMFYVDPACRRAGLGTHLLEHGLGFARSSGYRRIVLSTYSSHRAACALYARNGFTCIASKPARAYGRELTELDWERMLDAGNHGLRSLPADAAGTPGPMHQHGDRK